jgi:hypothetical protein
LYRLSFDIDEKEFRSEQLEFFERELTADEKKMLNL